MPHLVLKSSLKAYVPKALVAILVALIVCSNVFLTAKSKGQVDNRLTSASTRFSLKLYDRIRLRDPKNNTFVSPASIMLALAMAYNGANGTTSQAMARALEIDGMSREEANQAFADLRSALAPTDPDIQLKIANSLWARKGFALKPAFLERNKQYFGAEVASLDFSSPTATQTINSWVSKNTEGKIEKIINNIDDGDVLFLINAIYFKGQWQNKFDKKMTKPDVFTLAGGERKELPMMSQSGSYSYYKGKDFQSVALPYGKGGGVSMYVFLPDEQKGLEKFEQDLTPENWDGWMKSFRGRPGTVMLPRFKVEWEANLNEALKSLGMEEAFDGTRADFSQIAESQFGTKLAITEVVHKSVCEVNEEGTVAAAATSVGVGIVSLPPPPFVMKVDRPFFFAIRDNQTGLVLFMGSVRYPG